MARCRAEFIVEPFEEGHPGAHVAACISAARGAGLEPDIGPYGTAVEGEPAAILRALDTIVAAGLEAGATRISVQMTVLAS